MNASTNATNMENEINLQGVITDPCGGCLNGGNCKLHSDAYYYCECGAGFEGDRCSDTYIDFQHGNAPKAQIGTELIVVIVVVCFALVVMAIVGFLTWRRCARVRERRKWVKWQETRHQSKATIEGFTNVEPAPCPSHSGFGIKLLKNINRTKAFTCNGPSNAKDTKNVHGNPEWIATICSERNSTLPCTGHEAKESQISIVLNKSRISFVTYTPDTSKDSSVQTTVVTNESEVHSTLKKNHCCSHDLSISQEVADSEKDSNEVSKENLSNTASLENKSTNSNHNKESQDKKNINVLEVPDTYHLSEVNQSDNKNLQMSFGRRLSCSDPKH